MAKEFLRYGMVGGGPGAFIGGVHRSAIAMDGDSKIVSGCFSRNPEKNLRMGESLEIAPDRLYGDYEEMAEQESRRPDPIDFVSIVTQNYAHYAACKAFLSRGIHVMCEKPLTTHVAEAKELAELAKKNNCLFGISYTYTGHTMAKVAREIIRNGEIGDVIVVMGEYPQDWLMSLVTEGEGGISAWRIDPKVAGGSNCVGDIGSHIENMISYMTGLKINKLCAVMDKFGPGVELDNNAHILIKYDNGATGTYWSSQVAIGNNNGLKVRIYGTQGAIEFDQEESEKLLVTKRNHPPQVYSRGCGYVNQKAARFSRIPSGHPEGYHEAFANLYKEFGRAVWDKKNGTFASEENYDYANADAGVDGVLFIEKCMESASADSAWVNLR